MGTWFCPGHPTWDCQDLGVAGGWSTIAECCAYCNNCQHSTGTSTWQCDSLTNKCSLQTGSDGYSTKLLCDRICNGVSNGSDTCNDPLNIGCTSGIPNTYLIGGAILVMLMMMKK